MRLIIQWQDFKYGEHEHVDECPVFIPSIKDIVTTPDGHCGTVDYRHYNMQKDTLFIRVRRS